MARGKETECTKELVDSIRQSGGFAYKIGDTPMASGLRFTAEKPFDAVVCLGGRFIAIEAKYFDRFKRFGVKDLRECQVKGLDQVEAANGLALVALFIKVPAQPLKGIKRFSGLYIFEWSWLKLMGVVEIDALKKMEPLTSKKGIYPMANAKIHRILEGNKL